MKKKLISLFLAAAMTFSMLAMPINAFHVDSVSHYYDFITGMEFPGTLTIYHEDGTYENIEILDEEGNQLYIEVGENEWEKLDTPIPAAEVNKRLAEEKAAKDAAAEAERIKKKAEMEKAYNLKISEYFAQSIYDLNELETQIRIIPEALYKKVAAQLTKMGKTLKIEDLRNTNHDSPDYGGFYTPAKVQIDLAPFSAASSFPHEYGHMVFMTVLPQLYKSSAVKQEWNALKGSEGPTHVSAYASTAYNEDLAETFDALLSGWGDDCGEIKLLAMKYPDCLAIKKINYMRQLLCKVFSLDTSVFPDYTPSYPSPWAKAEIEKYQTVLCGSDESVVPYEGAAHPTGYQKPATRMQFVHAMLNDMVSHLWGTHVFKGLTYDEYRAKWFPASTNGKYPMPFTDIPSNKTSVYSMYTNGVINGKSDTIFDPQGQLTRQEAATILYRLCNALGYKLPKGNADNFADANKIAPWAKDAVAAISAAGIMNGVGNDNFDPTGVYTCEQSALTILRTYEMLIK